MKFVLLVAAIAGQTPTELSTHYNALACNQAAIEAANTYQVVECHGPGVKNPSGVVTYVLPRPTLRQPDFVLEIRQ